MVRLVQSADRKLTRIARIRGVDVWVHWSVFVIAGLMLLGVINRPWMTIVGVLCYLGVLLIHELGHAFVAQRLHSEVMAIELYPIHGVTRFQVPWSRFDHTMIAWGGVLAQALVAAPLIAFVAVFGYTRFEPLNAMLAILGFFSAGIIVVNLLPMAPLDGSLAWSFFPEWFARLRNRRAGKPPSWGR